MKLIKLLLNVLVLLMSIIPYVVFSQTDTKWELVMKKNGIKVYTGMPEGCDVKEFKGETKINTSPENLYNLLKNPYTYPQWFYSVKKAYLIKKADNLYYIYSLIDFPWPFDDRDQITTTEFIKDTVAKSILCKINILKTSELKKKGTVRITDGEGFWVLQDDGKGGCDVTFRFYADPGGRMPKSIVNMFIENSPYKTLSALKEMFP